MEHKGAKPVRCDTSCICRCMGKQCCCSAEIDMLNGFQLLWFRGVVISKGFNSKLTMAVVIQFIELGASWLDGKDITAGRMVIITHHQLFHWGKRDILSFFVSHWPAKLNTKYIFTSHALTPPDGRWVCVYPAISISIVTDDLARQGARASPDMAWS